jgi:hypothetical protein
MYYAPNSLAQAAPTVAAGEVLNIPLTLKQNTNSLTLGSMDFGSEWVKLTASATITSSAYNRTFYNPISSSGAYSLVDGQPRVSITFDAATSWSLG